MDRVAEAEARYTGERSPRRPWLAFALSLVAPGLGWMYLGRLSTGVLLNLLHVSAWVGFVVAWSSLKFFPMLPAIVFASGLAVVSFLVALDAYRFAQRWGADHVARETNHPLVLSAALVLTWVLPLSALQAVTMRNVWALAHVSDDAMYPTLLAGDWLLVERSLSEDEPYARGEVVLLEHPDRSESWMVSRVIAVPGDEVRLSDEVSYTNATILTQHPMEPTTVERLSLVVGPLRSDLSYFTEIGEGTAYPIAQARAGGFTEPRSWKLSDGEYLVLNDNRSSPGDSRTFGPVRRELVVGRPLFVAMTDDDATAMVGRVGRRVQSPRTDPGTPPVPMKKASH